MLMNMDAKAARVYKVLIAGPVGVGKTTAVKTASDEAILTTEARPTDSTKLRKESTTVAMDFSVIWLDDHYKVHLYGAPGQERFDFMWSVLSKGNASIILLADHTSPNVFAEIKMYMDAFQPMIDKQQLVLGVTRLENNNELALQAYRNYFNNLGMNVPVLEADPRSRHDVLVLIRASLSITQLRHPA